MPRVLILSNPRSGSTYLSNLLNSHPEVEISDELLNDEENIAGDPILHVEKILSSRPETFVGFKLFPEQLFQRQLRFDDLVTKLGVQFVIVVWRESLLEAFASLQIAEKTGVWFSTKEPNKTETVAITQQAIEAHAQMRHAHWQAIADQWPTNGLLEPVFVRYEDLASSTTAQVKLITSRLGCNSNGINFTAVGRRQNPAKLEDKVTTWSTLPEEIRNIKFDAQQILINSNVAVNRCLMDIPSEVLPHTPDREPPMPPGGWRYRVADPYMSSQMKQNVMDAIESGSVSSAGYWPRQLASRLKQLFRVPVAQPCNNGFTALLLTMQAVTLQPDDEVILPSLTMVAVANAVHFARAKPVFADSAPDNYNPPWSEILKVSTEKTKMVIVTHTYGVPCPDIELISAECTARGWWLLEDISEAVGIRVMASDGRWKLLGTFGHFAAASMYVNKMVHAGDGGFVIAQNVKYGPRLLSLVNHGFTPAYHFVHLEPAVNAKINGLGAALACGCLEEIGAIMEHRTQLSSTYRQLLTGIPVKVIPRCGPLDTPWIFGLECKSKRERTELRRFLAYHGIETRDYFFPIHLQPAFFTKLAALPFAESFGSTGFYLPTHSNLGTADIEFIAAVVVAYFKRTLVTITPPVVKQKYGIQIKPDGFQVQMRNFISGELVRAKDFRGHAYFMAVKLGLLADRIINSHERWDERQLLLQDMNECITLASEEDLTSVQTFFEPYIVYLTSQLTFEPPSVKPWLLVDLASEAFLEAMKIPGTTDPETLQLLIWLTQSEKPRIIWEIGCWLGQATWLMATAGQQVKADCKIFACDAFKWQEWMSERVTDPALIMRPFDSFKRHFTKFTEQFADVIEPVDWGYDTNELPTVLQDQKPDLVFLDISQDVEELESVWKLIKPNLIPNQTVIVVNGVTRSSIPFLTTHAGNLLAIAKPSSIAKVFRFVSAPLEKMQQEPRLCSPALRKVNFQSDPAWDHHHKNLYVATMQRLKEEHHDDSAEVLFFPAIEESMSHGMELFLNQYWIGIIHSAEVNPELHYAPDLHRLCGSHYQKAMKNCKGLFTLTQFQATFLKNNLNPQFCFPIQPLLYPIATDADSYKTSNIPLLWEHGSKIDLLFVGSYGRDFQCFFDAIVPSKFRKVLLVGEESAEAGAKKAPSNVTKLDRLSESDYESALANSIVFLALKHDGAANTITVECIARNVPIIAPAMQTCVEYLGADYPLLYNPVSPDFNRLLTLENVQKAIAYLQVKNKSNFCPDYFAASVKNGAVMCSIPPMKQKVDTIATFGSQMYSNHYDVTVCLCSFKRTHNLPAILKSLWESQDFAGKIQIIVWNNNYGRDEVVRKICENYVQSSSSEKSLELITSTENHYCSVRLAMPILMRSEALLICDDDVLPAENFISFFLAAHQRRPRDVLCLRGHVFTEHDLHLNDPATVWRDYQSLRFYSDESPERFIHFVHADACLIPKDALQECASVPMSDPTFALVDDYWMSYVLNHKFARKLRKLSTANLAVCPLVRTADSETVGLALHTRAEVVDARLRFYIYHMTNGWPKWSSPKAAIDFASLKAIKGRFWEKPFIGFNLNSNLNEPDICDLKKANITCVRIGAVGIGRKQDFDLCELLVAPEDECERLGRTIKMLETANIKVVLTVDRRLGSAEVWSAVAAHFASNPNIVGYDLINEPFTTQEKELDLTAVLKVEATDIQETVLTYTKLIRAIRAEDQATPIIVEPTFWAHLDALEKLPIVSLLQVDSNLIASFHFYEPQRLTQRRQNKNRFTFPGPVPVYAGAKHSELIFWDEGYITSKLSKALQWAKDNKVRIIVGEFGICRDISGAAEYLQSIMNFCRTAGLSGFLFSFRDFDWDGMNYEIGGQLDEVMAPGEWEENPLMQTILSGIRAMGQTRPSQFFELFENY